jgi:hypothetical protein
VSARVITSSTSPKPVLIPSPASVHAATSAGRCSRPLAARHSWRPCRSRSGSPTCGGAHRPTAR